MQHGIAYPRREDAVVYEQFDGTLESAQIIANLIGHPACVDIDPDPKFQTGDVARLKTIHYSGGKVNRGDYVVRSVNAKDGSSATVYPPEAFAEKFSKDGR